jgi:hypothetical protein
MSRFSPTREGFRAVFRRPSLVFAEIVWRWSVGAVGGILFTFALIEYFDTLPVSKLDADLLASRQVLLVWHAVTHIFRGSLARVTSAALSGLLALSVLWIIAASLGRAAIVRTLIGRDSADENGAGGLVAVRSMIGLSCLRVVATLAALLALLGAALIVHSEAASPDASHQPVLLFLIFVLLSAVIALTWVVLNWLLSFASIFAVRNGEDTTGAIAATVGCLSEHFRPLLAVSTWNGIAHFAAVLCASSVASLIFVFFAIVPARLVVGALILLALAYFAFVDWLYVARLAGYICIAETPEELSSATFPATPPSDGRRVSATSTRTAVDRDEPILSDLPGLASEPFA